MGLLDRFKKQKEKELSASTKPEGKAVKKAEGKTEKTETKAEAKAVKTVRQETTRVIVAPLVTEKAAHLSEANTYVFQVAVKATRV